MFKWKKLGKVFTPQEVEGRTWLKEFAQAPATLVFDTFVRVYFSCRPPADENGQYVSYSAYVELDRSDMFKVLLVSEQPILDLGGLGEFDEFGTYPVSVLRNGEEVRAYCQPHRRRREQQLDADRRLAGTARQVPVADEPERGHRQ